METLDLKQAAELLKMNAEVLRRGVKAGLIPGAKIGKRWLFIQEDLIHYIRSKSNYKGKQWLSTNEEKYGGLDLPHQLDNEYLNLLELKTR